MRTLSIGIDENIWARQTFFGSIGGIDENNTCQTFFGSIDAFFWSIDSFFFGSIDRLFFDQSIGYFLVNR